MFLKLFQGVRDLCVRGFAKQIHTQMCLNSLFDQRRLSENDWKKKENEWKKKENEWEDDEHEQKRAFHEEERIKMQENKQPTCEMTGKAKRAGSVDCNCKRMCTANKSETYTIHYEGGVGIIPKK
jgi:hypothetical protein